MKQFLNNQIELKSFVGKKYTDFCVLFVVAFRRNNKNNICCKNSPLALK